ncbi:MAG: hypothetical protein VYC34_02320 [Planctomycetota bacterium]|nr:hypothetical protein [Planctomycetota bacterium]
MDTSHESARLDVELAKQRLRDAGHSNGSPSWIRRHAVELPAGAFVGGLLLGGVRSKGRIAASALSATAAAARLATPFLIPVIRDQMSHSGRGRG